MQDRHGRGVERREDERNRPLPCRDRVGKGHTQWGSCSAAH